MIAAESIPSTNSSTIDDESFFCPDCARRQWSRAYDNSTRRGYPSYWQWALVVVGVFLIAGNALEFSRSAANLITSDLLLSSVPRYGWHATPDFADPQLMLRTSALVADAGSFDAVVPPIILGLLAVFVGLGSTARIRLDETDRGQPIASGNRPSRPNQALPRYVRNIWEIVELFAVSFIRVLVVGFVLFIVDRAIHGEPPTLDLLNASLTRTVDLGVKLVGLLAP